MSRELTRDEKTVIRRLVTSLCANFDREYGCLPLDCECNKLGKCWIGAYCRYFREAVLPTDPVLEAALTQEGLAPEVRVCAVCGKRFFPEGNQAYCSAVCSESARRKRQRDYMRKRRAER